METKEKLPLKLFRCEVGGATYSVAALHAEHAREVLLSHGEEHCDEPEDIESAEIREYTTEETQRIKVRDDDEGTSQPLAEFIQELTEPRIIGCSEW